MTVQSLPSLPLLLQFQYTRKTLLKKAHILSQSQEATSTNQLLLHLCWLLIQMQHPLHHLLLPQDHHLTPHPLFQILDQVKETQIFQILLILLVQRTTLSITLIWYTRVFNKMKLLSMCSPLFYALMEKATLMFLIHLHYQ